MDRICGYFDTQGFYHKGLFHPLEVAVLGGCVTMSAAVDHNLNPTKFSKKDKKNVNFAEKYHGIPCCSTNQRMDPQLLPIMLQNFYEGRATDSKYLIACKSLEAERILTTLAIPCINIVDQGATWKNISNGRKPCHLHLNGDKCSLNAVLDLNNWVDSL